MNRRDFVATLVASPLLLTACGDESSNAMLNGTHSLTGAGFKSFGYYQGLLPTQNRSANRKDGTYHNMPCISEEDVRAGLEKTYRFWHGHSADHLFTLTSVDYEKLRLGETIEVYTTVVDGHRHAVRVSPAESCAM